MGVARGGAGSEAALLAAEEHPGPRRRAWPPRRSNGWGGMWLVGGRGRRRGRLEEVGAGIGANSVEGAERWVRVYNPERQAASKARERASRERPLPTLSVSQDAVPAVGELGRSWAHSLQSQPEHSNPTPPGPRHTASPCSPPLGPIHTPPVAGPARTARRACSRAVFLMLCHRRTTFAAGGAGDIQAATLCRSVTSVCSGSCTAPAYRDRMNRMHGRVEDFKYSHQPPNHQSKAWEPIGSPQHTHPHYIYIYICVLRCREQAGAGGLASLPQCHYGVAGRHSGNHARNVRVWRHATQAAPHPHDTAAIATTAVAPRLPRPARAGRWRPTSGATTALLASPSVVVSAYARSPGTHALPVP